MNVSIDMNNEHEIEMSISSDWDAVCDDYNDLLKEYSKLSVKGFRRSNTPVSVIETLFARQLANDLAAKCSTRLCAKAMKQERVSNGSPVEITNIIAEKDKRFFFKARFFKMPEFVVPDYNNMNLQSLAHDEKLTELSEKLLNKTIINLHSSFIDNELKYSEDDSADLQAQRNAAADRVKLFLILNKIAAENGIEVDQKDIEERIKQAAAENNTPLQELKEYLLSNGGISRLHDYILAEYTLNYIIDMQGNGQVMNKEV